MYKTVPLYGDTNDVKLGEIISELADCGIKAKAKGSDKIMVSLSDITHEQAFDSGSIVENVISYQYNESVMLLHSQEIESLKRQIKELKQQLRNEEEEFSIPFTVQQLEDIVY